LAASSFKQRVEGIDEITNVLNNYRSRAINGGTPKMYVYTILLSLSLAKVKDTWKFELVKGQAQFMKCL